MHYIGGALNASVFGACSVGARLGNCERIVCRAAVLLRSVMIGCFVFGSENISFENFSFTRNVRNFKFRAEIFDRSNR